MGRKHRGPDRKLLYQELRLIEKCESEVNGAWKGTHILLFFLAFVFGSFCTFCFHLLMYLFEEKCVLFPKLLTMAPTHPNVIYELFPDDNKMLQVDFMSTQWVEKSACYLPTYVPLVSGIFGLVWTTMFLMCSTGRETLTGLQHPWRVIPPVFIFSLAMGSLSIYTSTITHRGLDEMCVKLGEITGSPTCSYSINVATLLYERKIRGVYQATRLTITTAWLHTFCWILSALLALIRVLLVVDFRLVKVNVELIGDVEQMLERNEEQLRTVSPVSTEDKNLQNTEILIDERIKVIHTDNRQEEIATDDQSEESRQEKRIFKSGSKEITQFASIESDTLFFNDRAPQTSALSLNYDEEMKLVQQKKFDQLPKAEQYIFKILYDLMDEIDFPETESISPTVSIGAQISKQYVQEFTSLSDKPFIDVDTETEERSLSDLKESASDDVKHDDNSYDDDNSMERKTRIAFESLMNLTPEMRREFKFTSSVDDNNTQVGHSRKSSLKKYIDKKIKEDKKTRVQISDSRDAIIPVSSEISSDSKADKETQTDKAKQD